MKKYETYEDAQAAAQKLTPIPTSQREYKKVSTQDPRLSKVPDKKYNNEGWTSWEAFLGREKKDFYETYEEAQAAVQKLSPVPTTRKEYFKAYKKLPRLTATPYVRYKKKGWISWEVFLGIVGAYETYEEAQAATQKLTPAPSTQKEYNKAYKQVPRLIAKPDVKYKNKGWTSWEMFLNKTKKELYETYEEARAATQQLNPVPCTGPEYTKAITQDPRLTKFPHAKYKNKGWTNWETFLGKEKKELYETYEEAQAAVHKLRSVPTTKTEYCKLYKQDLRLTVNPDRKYNNKGWTRWADFLGKETKDLYETYKEAQAAAQKLTPVPTSQREYTTVCTQDPRLPSNPARTYADDWTDLYHYLGVSVVTYKELISWVRENAPNIRKTSELVKSLENQPPFRAAFLVANKNKLDGFYDFASIVGVEYQDPLEAISLINTIKPTLSSIEEYLELRQWYRSLPKCPVITYGFEDFESFLSFDKSMFFDKNQAIDFCAKHKIKNLENYVKFSLITPQLPLKPSLIKGVTKLSQIRYTPSAFEIALESNEYAEWVSLADMHCASGKNASGRKSIIKSFFVYFKKDLKASITEQFSNQTPLIDPTGWFNQLADSQRNESTLNKLNNFLNFVLEEKFCAIDAKSGESVLQEGFRSPINFKNLPVEFIITKSIESNKTALPFKYIQKARDFIAADNVASLGGIYQSIKSKSDYFDNYHEWFEVDESSIDKNDVNCIWKKDGNVFYMWSPVKVVATLLQLYMPFRGAQIAWLDSGEADKYKLQLENGKLVWVANNLLNEYRVPVKRWQGFLKPTTFGDKNSLVSCHVNSNKTSKSSAAGYDVPWIDERVLPFIVQLRDWQEKYNPIKKPKKWIDADLQKYDANSELSKFGHNGGSCFLMRDPCNADGQSPIKQYTIGSTLKGVLHLIEDGELALTQLNHGFQSEEYGKATSLTGIKTIFTLHSMRVSLITAYIVDAKIAPEVVQKLVGHSSIVMTIYYTKVEAETIRDALQEAEPRIIANQVDRVEQLNRQRKLDKLASELIDENGEIKKSQLHQEPAGNIFMDHGICPNGQTKCADATTQGYLGSENCLSCPHYLTGPAFLGGLQMLVNEISFECKAVATRIEDLREEVDVLESEQYQALKEGRVFSKAHKLSIAESTYQKEVVRFDGLTVDMIKAVRFSMSAIELLNEKSDENNSTKLITQNDAPIAHIQLNEVSDYIQLDTICQGAEFFQSSRPEFASPQRTQLIDLFARKNGLEPSMFALSAKQQITIGNQVTNLLLARLGSYKKLSQAMDKESTITLEELGVSDVKNIRIELNFLMEGSAPTIGHTNPQNVQVELQ